MARRIARMDLAVLKAEMPGRVLSAINGAAGEANSYPEEGQGILKAPLCRELAVGPENLVCGNGADEVIDLAVRAFAGGRGSVAIVAPTFSGYEMAARRQGCGIRLMGCGFGFDAGEILRKSEGADILFICSPNNPTGAELGAEELERIAGSFRGVVALDQALIDPADETFVELAMRRRNLVLIRSFSKSRGLAGMRVGFAIGREDIIRRMDEKRQVFNLNSVSQAAAAASLSQGERALGKLRKGLETERRFLLKGMEKAGMKIAGVCPNTVLLDFGSDEEGERAVRELGVAGIRVFGGGNQMDFTGLSKRFVRVAVSDREDNERFLSEIGKILRRMRSVASERKV